MPLLSLLLNTLDAALAGAAAAMPTARRHDTGAAEQAAAAQAALAGDAGEAVAKLLMHAHRWPQAPAAGAPKGLEVRV